MAVRGDISLQMLASNERDCWHGSGGALGRNEGNESPNEAHAASATLIKDISSVQNPCINSEAALHPLYLNYRIPYLSLLHPRFFISPSSSSQNYALYYISSP